MTSNLSIYLRSHEAAAQGGRDLFRRVATNQRSKPYGDQLHVLADDVAEDLRRLRRLMSTASVQPDLALGVTVRMTERVARLKPNGRALFRAPLSDLIEIEGLLDAVRAKSAGWQALLAASRDGFGGQLDAAAVHELDSRANDQIERLRSIHAEAAKQTLGTDN